MGAALAALVALGAGAPAAARAAVAIGPERIVVSGPGGSATIARRPFSISFGDRSGRTVLREVPDSGQAPLPIPPTPDPVPLGTDTRTRPTLYAPLTFTVGAAREFQYPNFQWEGNELAGTEAGVQYSAREVVDAAVDGDGARLTVATSDPSGRRLAVTIAPGPEGTFRVTVRPTPVDGVATMGDSFATSADEAFRGFGGRHNALDERGQDFYNWIEQENLGTGFLQPAIDPVPGSGGRGYLFPNGPTGAYYVQSQFLSSRGYGFLLDRDEISRWRLASDRPDAWQVGVGAAGLDYLVAPDDALRRLTAVGGRQPAPPAWGLGPMLDRLVRFPNETAESYQAAVADDLAHLARHEIPLTGYRVEGWHFYDDAGLKAVIGRLRGLGVHALVYFRSFSDNSRGGTDDPRYFDEARQNGYASTTPTGQPYVFLDNFNSPAVEFDFTNPATVAWWTARIVAALDLGADGFMQDFGEQTQVDMRFHDGSTGAQMHNRYPVIYHRLTSGIVADYERRHPGRQIFWYTRSGYSGTPGSAAYEPSNFPGDETTDWSRSSGLASLTTDMLNRAVGGAYGFNADVGGYFDVGPYSPTTKELFLRWAEWSALSPVMRLHGSVGAGTHAPWSFDAETVRIYAALSRLHEKAAALILRLWRQADQTGTPVTLPLWLAYPGDAEAARQDQEWLLGPDVLVAPVVEEGARSRDVYFPAGCWQSPDAAEAHQGPGHARVAAPLDRLPYFFRCGTSPLEAAALPHLRLVASCGRGRDAGRVRARVLGFRHGQVRRVTFYAGRHRAAVDSRSPFARWLPASAFSGRRWRVTANARLAAGRLVRLHRALARCPAPRRTRGGARFTG